MIILFFLHPPRRLRPADQRHGVEEHGVEHAAVVRAEELQRHAADDAPRDEGGHRDADVLHVQREILAAAPEAVKHRAEERAAQHDRDHLIAEDRGAEQTRRL